MCIRPSSLLRIGETLDADVLVANDADWGEKERVSPRIFALTVADH